MRIKKNPTYSDYMDQLHTLVHELKRVEVTEKDRLCTIIHITSFSHLRSTSDHMDWKPTDVIQLAAVREEQASCTIQQ